MRGTGESSGAARSSARRGALCGEGVPVSEQGPIAAAAHAGPTENRGRTEPPLAGPARVSLRGNWAWNLVGAGVPLAVGLVTIPFLIRSTGVEGFGILTLVWSLIGYFSIFDFGIGRALTQQVSSGRSHAAGEIPALVKHGLLLMLLTGSCGAALLTLLAYPLGHVWMNVSPGLQETATRCLRIAALGIPVSTVTSGLKGVLEGYEDFRTSSLLRLLFGILNFVMPAAAALATGGSLDYMVASEGFYNNCIRVNYDGAAAPSTNNMESLFDSGNGSTPAGTPVDMASVNDATDCPHKGFEARIPWSVLYAGTRFGTADQIAWSADIDALLAIPQGRQAGNVRANVVALNAVVHGCITHDVKARGGIAGKEIAGRRKGISDHVERRIGNANPI